MQHQLLQTKQCDVHNEKKKLEGILKNCKGQQLWQFLLDFFFAFYVNRWDRNNTNYLRNFVMLYAYRSGLYVNEPFAVLI